VLSIIEYNIPKMIFNSVRLEIKTGKTVLESSIDIARAKNAPCQINIIYVLLLFDANFTSDYIIYKYL